MFHAIDWIIVVVYLVGITLFGVHFRKKHQSIHTYFLGGKTIPAWALALSIVATETSTLTIIGTPGIAYGGNLAFLQVALGYIAGRIFVSLVLVPAYFRGEMYTAYELIRRRFGERLKHATASMFLVTRVLADGVRVFATGTVVTVVLGTGDVLSVVIIFALTLLYTFEGGLTAVIWTDVIQLVIYIAGTAAAFVLLLGAIPGGWDGVLQVASNKLDVWNFSLDFTLPYTFWAGLLGGAFLSTASHGVDQLIVQRLLAARNERDGKLALVWSGVIVLAQFALLLLVGVLLYAYYQHNPQETVPAARDRIFVDYVFRHLPTGMSGLMIAAILAAAMSTLSGSLNSLASTTVVDFYRGIARREMTPAQELRLSRWMTVVWGVVMSALALLSRGVQSVLEAGLTIASITYGSMLGVFLLGVLTRRANQSGSFLGMAVGLLSMLAIWYQGRIAWTWYVLIGTAITFATGYAASLVAGRRNSAA